MIVCDVTIPGAPVPWARAVDNAGGSGRHTPAKQKGFKKVVRDYLSFGTSPRVRMQPAGIALNLACRIYLPFPPKHPLADRARAEDFDAFAVDRPDLDNWLKLPMDAANGIVWVDDAQVVSFDGSGKWYTPSAPRLEFVVTRLVA